MTVPIHVSIFFISDEYSIGGMYEINGKNLEILHQQTLGQGNFGIVYKGIWIHVQPFELSFFGGFDKVTHFTGILTKSNGDWHTVAVKMMRRSETDSYYSRQTMDEVRYISH